MGEDTEYREQLTYLSDSDRVLGYASLAGSADRESGTVRLSIAEAGDGDGGSAVTWSAIPALLMTGPHDRLAPPAEIRSVAGRIWDAAPRPDVRFEVIGEVPRFPGIGRAYTAAGPDHLLRGIVACLTRQRAAGRLAFDDADLAAEDFWGLILSAPRNRALHRPDAPAPRPRSNGRFATACGCSRRPVPPTPPATWRP